MDWQHLDWPNLILSIAANGVILAALGAYLKYSLDKRLKGLEADLKLKSLIDETVFKNMAVTVKEATKHLLEYHRTIAEYYFAQPRTNYTETKNAVAQKHHEFNRWFEVESLHLPDSIKADILVLFNHLNAIAFLKGMVLLNTELQFKDDAKRESLDLVRERNKTEEIIANYHAKMKAAIGVSPTLSNS